MPRSGGESGKLGDRYEAVWTVDSLLDVLAQDADSIVVEPFDRAELLGIEFRKDFPGTVEFHSAKRQTSGQLWSLADLTRVGENGRSVLGDLLSKLQSFSDSKVVFVSGTTARDLEALSEAAAFSTEADAFQARLDTSDRRLRRDFEDRLLRPHFHGDLANAWRMLQRIRVVGWTESEMIRRVDQRIRGALYRPDCTPLDAAAARCLLADMVLDRFGQTIGRETVLNFLREHGIAERDWTRSGGPREIVDKRNAAYTRNVEAELIAGERIPRVEAERVAEVLIGGGRKRAIFIGAAGDGKSCAVAQTLVHLSHNQIPYLALRLDIQTTVLTSQQLGREMGLPESPAVVLAGVANGGRCVLILDQLDAISFASGRNQRLWDVFEELLAEAQSHPRMRVLLACRAFDAAHDPRLRRIVADADDTTRVDLEKLSLETVSTVARKAGVDPAALDPTHLELLRTPLHLSLYLQGDPRTQPRFSGVQELLGRYWTHKRRLVAEQLGRESRWHDIIERLVERLSRDQTLSAPRTVLDPFDEAEIAAMASQNVIVLDGDSVRFFHEAFFDYCSARLFAGQGLTLLQFLLEGAREQHLFRRAQVRQILEYEREHDFPSYLRDLRELLSNAGVRYHLKKLALDWLGKLPIPQEEEWRVLESLDSATPIGTWAQRVPWGRPGWFTLLDRLGVWKRWLEAPEPGVVSLAVRMISLPDVMKACSAQIAKLFRPYVDAKRWRHEFGQLFYFGELHHSREIFDLLLDTTRAGLLDPPSRTDWSRYDRLSKVRPDYAVELLGVLLDLETAQGGDDEVEEWEGEIGADFIIEAARGASEAFARAIMPRVISEIGQRDPDDARGWGGRRFWRRMTFRAYNASTALENGLEIGLAALAKEQPGILDTLTAPAEELPHETFAALLLSAWSENGAHYADKIIAYILSEPDRLGLGFIMWGTGNGVAAIARAAVRAAAPHCSAENYSALEAAILDFTPKREREEPKRLGYHRMLLLECLPANRISRKAQHHFEELKRKFPWEKFETPGLGLRGGVVESPVPHEATKYMTDEQWVAAMRKYAGERERNASDFLKGGKYELSSVLRLQAQSEKSRFAKLALRMEETIAPEYFGAIVSGITTTTDDTGVSPKLPSSAHEQLDVQEAVRVIQRVFAVAREECARDICWAIRRIADQKPSREIIPVVCHYAIHHPDPQLEQWQEKSGDTRLWGGDPHFQGMNSVRGAAAEALASLLFADQKWFAELESAVLSVVHDPSTAVRSCAILCLLAILNFDRDRAVQLFLELAHNTDAVLATHWSEQFIHYATYRHYESLRPTLLRMLQSPDENSRAIAGRQITLAAFHNSEAGVDVEQVLTGDVVCRKAAAEIYSHNLDRKAMRAICAERLANLFEDPDAKVRASASDTFLRISVSILPEIEDLIFKFIESAACIENSHDLIHALEQSTDPLPELICRLPERLIAEHRAQGSTEHIESRRWTYHLPALIARLYEQTPDPAIKIRCLDIIDDMLELGFSEIEEELAQVER